MTFLTHRVIWVTQLSQCLILMERFWGDIRHWLNCHCLTEYIRLFFIFEKLGFISRTSPEGHYPEVRERYEEDGDWFLTMADFMYFFFFKQNITFLLSPLSSASFNDINGQMDLAQIAGVASGVFGGLMQQPLEASGGQLRCASAVQTRSVVGNPHLWRADRLLWRERHNKQPNKYLPGQ